MKTVMYWWIGIFLATVVGGIVHESWRKDECKKCEEWRDNLPPPAPNERRSNPCKDFCQ